MHVEGLTLNIAEKGAEKHAEYFTFTRYCGRI
jgi:hypothetical protein